MQPVPNFRGNNSAFTTALTCGDERQADLCVDQTAQRGWLVLRALQDRVGEQRGPMPKSSARVAADLVGDKAAQ